MRETLDIQGGKCGNQIESKFFLDKEADAQPHLIKMRQVQDHLVYSISSKANTP
jgi:hypothetical protein